MFDFVYKMKFHQDKILAALKGDLSKSLSTVLFYMSSGICNHRCIFCDGTNKYPAKRIDWVKLTELAQDMKNLGVNSIILLGEGSEIILDSNFVDFSNQLLSYGMHLGIYTNGSICNKELVDCLSKYDFVRVSLDAGTLATHRIVHGYRGRDDFSTACNLMTSIHNKGACDIGVSFVICKENVNEIEKAALIALSCGAKYIEYKLELKDGYVFNSKQYTELLPTIEQQIMKAQTIENANFSIVLNNHLKLLISNEISVDKLTLDDEHKCLTSLLRIVINPFGYHLCTPFKFDATYRIAPLDGFRLNEIWGSPRHIELLSQKCSTRCTYYKQNQEMLAMENDMEYFKMKMMQMKNVDNVQEYFL